MRTYADLFTGGGGATIGAMQAGFTPIWGIENDPAIADVARLNGLHVLTADVCAVDYTTLPAVSWLHASPPCTNASQAKTDAGETPLDGELASAVCRAIRDIRPACFTLENVFGYRTFNAFAAILQALRDCGYSFDHWHLNSADFGVPQTRKRLILIAKLGEHRIQRPEATHRDGGDMFLPPWIGWLEAIADLIPTLPESKFANWQLQRLPAEMTTSLVQGDNARSEEKGGVTVIDFDYPAFTVTATAKARAFIVDGATNDAGRTVTVPNGHEPMMTVMSNGNKHKMRAFLVGGANTSEDQAGPGVGVSEAHEPTRCVNASNSQYWRAWLEQGRVVSMSPRALARFMGVEDSYILPEKSSLACKILGNMVCPPLMRIIGESL